MIFFPSLIFRVTVECVGVGVGEGGAKCYEDGQRLNVCTGTTVVYLEKFHGISFVNIV